MPLDSAGDSPRLGEDGLPESWLVRLGVFCQADNAARLVARLKEAHYRAAHSEQLATTELDCAGGATGVYIGPWVRETRAKEVQRELLARLNMESVVVENYAL